MQGWSVGRQIAVAAALACGCTTRVAFGQPRRADLVERVHATPPVRSAVELSEALHPWVIEQQIALCEIPAPPFKERARGEAYRAAFEQLGLANVRTDAVGNVIGERPGLASAPHVVFSAHLDTVFPEGTPVAVTRTDGRLLGPGIADDCRGLAVVLGVVRALRDAHVVTPGRITFVGTVGEEGLGDLRGVKHLFGAQGLGRIDRFVSVDGAGLDIVHRGVGSRRYRATFRGPGGHSYGAFGMPNPIHALGRAIASIGEMQVPSTPKTTFNVGRIGGGTSVNSIPFEAWAEIDLRSEDASALATLDAKVRAVVQAAAVAENERWRHASNVTVEMALVGDRPAGSTPEMSGVVQSAVSVLEALSLPVTLRASSTDANVPMALGVPAITVGGGGTGRGAHSLEESFDPAGGVDGLRQAILLAVVLAHPGDATR